MGHLSIPATTVGSTLADLNRAQGVADDAGWQTTRAVLLTDLATITDRERFRERVERWRAEDAKAVGCCYVGNLKVGQSFRFRPGGTTHTVTLVEVEPPGVIGGVVITVKDGDRTLIFAANACVQLVEPQP